MLLNEEISELIGMHIGDGSLYLTSRGAVWELRGNLNEKEYYLFTVKKILESLFRIEFNPKFRSGGKNGCFGIQTSKKEVTHFFQAYGLSTGRKTHTAKIPNYIINSNEYIQYAFLRGLFDTDGCIRFDKTNHNKLHTYPRIEFCFASELLRDDLADLCKKLKFKTISWGKKYYKLCLAGNKQTIKWFNLIKPNNKKHLNKYQFWRREGYCGAEVA